MANITLIQYGPEADNCIARVCEKIQLAKNVIEKHTFSIVLQHYDTDETYAQDSLKCYQKLGYKITLVETSDLFNRGFYNINRMTHTISAALKQVGDGDIVIKLRNDQCVNFHKLFQHLDRIGFLDRAITKILTTNCFTRRDRLYHPSDMFLCSSGYLLKQYYSLPLQEETHTDVTLKIIEMKKKGISQRRSMLYAPESQQFVHFLKLKGWDFKFTDEDSLEAIRKYCFLVNSWNIDFCWEKKRTSGVKAGGIILPQNNFTCSPFPGAPDEAITCYDEIDIHGGQRNIKDYFYSQLSKALFGFVYDDSTHVIAALMVRIAQDGLVKTIICVARARLPRLIAMILPKRSRPKVATHKNVNWAGRYCHIVTRSVSLLTVLPFLLFVRGRR